METGLAECRHSGFFSKAAESQRAVRKPEAPPSMSCTSSQHRGHWLEQLVRLTGWITESNRHRSESVTLHTFTLTLKILFGFCSNKNAPQGALTVVINNKQTWTARSRTRIDYQHDALRKKQQTKEEDDEEEEGEEEEKSIRRPGWKHTRL